MTFKHLFTNIAAFVKKPKVSCVSKSHEPEQRHKKDQALRRLLYYSLKNSAWYQKNWRKLSLDTISHEDMLEFPKLTKKILMDNWDEIVTDPALNLQKVIRHLDRMSETEELLPLDDKYLVLSTSGSSGRKGIFVYDFHIFKKLIINRYLTFKQTMSQYVDFSNDKPLRTAQIIVTNAVYGMYAAFKTYTPDYERKYYFPVTKPLHEIVDGLNEVQPHRLVALPSTIYFLCQKAKAGELRINPVVIVVGAEPFYEPIRQLIYQIWPNVRLFNLYGTSEGLRATSCKAGSKVMHVHDDNHLIIPVNNEYQAVSKGNYSDKLLFTNLKAYLLPLINYEIEDRVKFLPENCPCGSSYPLIEEPQGRPEEDFFYSGNIMVHHLIFVTPLLTEGHVVEFQVIQSINGATINIVSNGSVNKNKIIRTIKQDYYRLGLAQAEITINEVLAIQHPVSGKLKRFIPLKLSL